MRAGREGSSRGEALRVPVFTDPKTGGPMNTRTIAIIALIIAVVVLILLLT